MIILATLVVFFFGTAMGSFLSVIIHRTHANLPGIFFGNSMCPHCKHQLAFFDLIPVLSFLFLKGTCRYCHKKIARHYIGIELITGITLAALYLRFPFLSFSGDPVLARFDFPILFEFLRAIFISLTLLSIFFYDLLYQEIPDVFSFVVMLLALIFNLVLGTPTIQEFILGSAAGAIFFQLQIYVSKGKWVGTGDVLVGTAMGLILGWQLLIVALFISYLCGALISTSLMIAKKANLKTKIPFAPFLVTGTILTMLFGNQLLQWYLGLIYG